MDYGVRLRGLVMAMALLQGKIEPGHANWNCREETSSCYHFSDFRMARRTASCWCRSIGGHLLKIDSLVELDLIQQLLARKNRPMPFWIGLTDKLKEGEFLWDDGTPDANITQWLEGEPSGTNYEQCVTLANYLSGIQSGVSSPLTADFLAIDWKCWANFYFVCEKGLTSSRLWDVVSRDVVYGSDRLGQVSNRNRVQCADLCTRTCGCLSVSHQDNGGDCIMYRHHMSRLKSGQNSPGYINYDTIAVEDK